MQVNSGVPIRCCARVAGKQSGRSDAEGSLFQSGNKLELVGPGRGGSEQASVSHTFSRIYDAHASDREVFSQEVQPLVDKFVDGSNVTIGLLGDHRGGHGQLLGSIAQPTVEAIFEAVEQRQAALGGTGGRLTPQLLVKYAGVVVGTELFSDLLAPGSSELRVVSDPEAVGGAQVGGGSAFGRVGAAARRSASLPHRPRAPPPAPQAAAAVVGALLRADPAGGRRQRRQRQRRRRLRLGRVAARDPRRRGRDARRPALERDAADPLVGVAAAADGRRVGRVAPPPRRPGRQRAHAPRPVQPPTSRRRRCSCSRWARAPPSRSSTIRWRAASSIATTASSTPCTSSSPRRRAS